jgi:hypothetical protein
MELNEATEILQNAGFLVEARHKTVDKQTVLDVLYGYILTSKKSREIVANYFKELLNTDDVQVYNSYYTQKVINHMSYADEGERQEKGTFLEVNGQTYLLVPNYLYHGVKNDMSIQELVKTGKLEPKKPI